MMRSSSLPAQNGGSGDAEAGEPGDAQTNTSFIQQSQHDSRGSDGCDASTQPPYHQEASYESQIDNKEYEFHPTIACPVPLLTQSCSGSLQDVYVAVMGVTGAGKSTFIEKLTGKEINVGHGLFSCKYF